MGILISLFFMVWGASIVLRPRDMWRMGQGRLWNREPTHLELVLIKALGAFITGIGLVFFLDSVHIALLV